MHNKKRVFFLCVLSAKYRHALLIDEKKNSIKMNENGKKNEMNEASTITFQHRWLVECGLEIMNIRVCFDIKL